MPMIHPDDELPFVLIIGIAVFVAIGVYVWLR